MNPSRENKRQKTAGEADPVSPRPGLLEKWMRLVASFDLREQWWRLLDVIEEKRRPRRALYALGVSVVLAVIAAVWVYPWWNQRNAIAITRGWLDAGRLDHAAEAAKEALRVAPQNPESWRLASAVAQRLGNKAAAEDYSRHASQLRPGDLPLALEWASSSLLADKLDAADEALASQPAGVLAGSPAAQRIEGELARRRGQYTDARDHFEAALKLDGPAAVDEVPLGIILLHAREQSERQRGLALLEKWAPSTEWGAISLRALLADALVHDDRPAMLRWADALRAHPRCTLGDIPNCLLALSKTDEARFADVLAIMEKHHAKDSGNIALLLSWLNQIGRSHEAVQWVKSLPPQLTGRPPAAVGAAEALRASEKWQSLLGWTRDADWGDALNSLRLSYALIASQKLNQPALAQEIWRTLQDRATTDGGRILFTADTLYSWGMHADAVALLWIISDQSDVAVKALGTLARYYQVEHDASGQYKVFQRLHSLRADDPSIANNYAYFAAITGNDLRGAEQIAGENFQAAPDSLAYRATYALVLCTQNRAGEALALLQPVAKDWKDKPAILLAYGLALAGNHRQTEAQNVFAAMDRTSLSAEESALINRALR